MNRQPKKILLAFGVGVGNLGVGSGGRRLMHEWVSYLNQRLASEGLGAKVSDFYGHTGNFVVESGGPSGRDLKSALADWMGTFVTVLEIERVRSYSASAAARPAPPGEPLVRWTPGLALRVRGGGQLRSDAETQRAVYHPLDHDAVAVLKRDFLLVDSDKLDPERRLGGWGAVAKEVGDRAGGVWTARSLRTVDGLIGGADLASR